MGMRLGVDVGGTFTDFCLLEPRRGALWVFKRPSTPQDQSDGIAAGIESLLTREGIAPSAVAFLAHGTTVATNALLEHRGGLPGRPRARPAGPPRHLRPLRRQTAPPGARPVAP